MLPLTVEDVNATTHTLDPWPPGVTNRRIPANGERMVHAIERYRRGPDQVAPANPVAAIGAAPAPGAAVGAEAPPAAPVVPAAGPVSQ